MNYFLAILGVFVIALFSGYYMLFTRYEALQEANKELEASLKSLELQKNEVKIKKVIEYRDKKIETIKRIPYDDKTCKNTLDSYNSLINSF